MIVGMSTTASQRLATSFKAEEGKGDMLLFRVRSWPSETPKREILMKDLLAGIASVQHLVADLTEGSSCGSWHELVLLQ